jgi:hypothetical protein
VKSYDFSARVGRAGIDEGIWERSFGVLGV